jgi:hypothetical protein
MRHAWGQVLCWLPSGVSVAFFKGRFQGDLRGIRNLVKGGMRGCVLV